MNRPLFAMLAAAVLVAAPPASAATVIGFEEIINPSLNPFPAAGYYGFNWGFGRWVVAEDSANLYSGVEVASGDKYAWSNGAGDLPMSLEGGGSFNLLGFSARGCCSFEVTAVARGFFLGTEIYTVPLSLTGSHSWQALNFVGIDKLLITDQTANVLIDDINVTYVLGPPIPEPGTYALMIAGLAGVGLVARRRRSQG